MTIEEVKEHFKDAVMVRDVYGDEFDYTKIKIEEHLVCSDVYIEDENFIDMILYRNGDKKLAEILTTKQDKQTSTKLKIDPIVTSVMTQLLTRSQIGISKYGTTLEENYKDDFLQHLKEELMDAVLYIEKLQTIKNK